MKDFFRKNWLVILMGCLSACLGVLTLLTVVKLRKTTPIAPTAPEKKPQAVIPACTLTFTLKAAPSPTPTKALSPTPGEDLSPTPSQTLSPTPTPTGTLTATPSPTSKPNELPVCTGLSANPTSGTAPLAVTFTGNGADRDGKITAFEFSFGNEETKTVEKDVEGAASHSLEYTYPLPGTYWASLRVRDNNGVWSDVPESCKVKIELGEKIVGGEEVSPTPEVVVLVPTATSIPVPEVPEAGIALPTILTILSGTLLIFLGILL